MKKTALVTGGARGIGRAISKVLAEDGWTVAVNYLNSEEAALSLSREINCLLVKADVSDENQVSAMFKRIKSEIGSIDLLVNNAGISSYGLFTDITPEDWRKMFSVNVDGVFYCCRQAVPDMIRKKHGCIINISSMWGQVGASCESAYSASKAAVIGLTKALAKELGPSGIRVNCISPAAFQRICWDAFHNPSLTR